jgi:hypothetical protein
MLRPVLFVAPRILLARLWGHLPALFANSLRIDLAVGKRKIREEHVVRYTTVLQSEIQRNSAEDIVATAAASKQNPFAARELLPEWRDKAVVVRHPLQIKNVCKLLSRCFVSNRSDLLQVEESQ